MADLRCESCGIPWSDHLGCQVLCAQLAALAETVERLQGRLADVLQHNEVLSANNQRLADANAKLWDRVCQLEVQLAEQLDGVQHSEYPEGKQ